VCVRVRVSFATHPHLACMLLCVSGYFRHVCWAVCFIKMGQVGDKRIVRVGFMHERGKTEKQFGNSKSGAPFVFENVDTDAAGGTDVWV